MVMHHHVGTGNENMVLLQEQQVLLTTKLSIHLRLLIGNKIPFF